MITKEDQRKYHLARQFKGYYWRSEEYISHRKPKSWLTNDTDMPISMQKLRLIDILRGMVK